MTAARPVVLTGVVEGLLDQAVLRRLVGETDATLGQVHGLQGKGRLLKQLNAYNQAAKSEPWVVLVDLDRDAECAPPCCQRWLPDRAPQMCFRIVVRAIEAWLLADREGLASFLGISVSPVPRQPETIDDPKLTLVGLARRSRRRKLREDMVPEPGGRTVGPRYRDRLTEFVDGHWRPEMAARLSDSLCRCRIRLRELIMRRTV
ncbi:MAG TPA: hypothetical protein VGX70_11975 [Gemmataceae bacterium]|nr:hypothetical protein [Gemmataceae bacterium]